MMNGATRKGSDVCSDIRHTYGTQTTDYLKRGTIKHREEGIEMKLSKAIEEIEDNRHLLENYVSSYALTLVIESAKLLLIELESGKEYSRNEL